MNGLAVRLGLRQRSPARRRVELLETVLDRGREWRAMRERLNVTLDGPGPYSSSWPIARAAEEAGAERLAAAIEELDQC